jgi:hypothetical protein
MSTAPPTGLDRQRLFVVLATVVLNVVAVAVFAAVPGSNWRTGLGLNLADNLLLLAHTIRRRDRLMAHFMVFGLVVGFVELAADACLVDVTRTLDYSPDGGPVLWRSPVWMPLAWEIVAVQFGYLGLRLWEAWRWRGLLLAGVAGAVNIPFYEEMARLTHWWQYRACRMLLHTPYYIIVGELLIVLALALLARLLRRERIAATLVAGVAGGLAIFLAYAAAFVITDGLPRSQ